MDLPTLPFPIDRPAKKQYRVSHNSGVKPKLQNHPQESSDGTAIEPKIPVSTPGTLTTEFMKLLRYNDSLAEPALRLLDL
ncbi:hypothetical protein DTO002I6_9846 [Penicillium roqueforti]|nr:hypothetical protein DTO002I6_9846 [Penicillium roqueforti]